MNSTKLLLLITIISLNTAFGQESPPLENPYLGQKPPGLTPEPFAPGIVTTDQWEVSGVFTPDLKEFFYIREGEESQEQEIVVIKNADDQWHESVLAPRVGTPFISPDGKTLHQGKWYRERTATGWSEKKSLEAPFKDLPIMRLTTSANGTYFFDEFKSDFTGDIRYSRFVDGKYEEPKLLSKKINSGKSFHPFIAPDESYLIFDGKREGGYGDSDIYISFKQHDGSWGDPINMGDKINTPAWEAVACVTPDGKYLFFNRNVGSDQYENVDIFWVDAQVIENLRPKPDLSSYEIAYSSSESSDMEIYLTDSEGKEKFQLTNREGRDGYVAWSPDGKKVAMYAYHDGGSTWSIHTMNTDGTNRQRLTHAKNKWDSAPTWSPDGKKIAFARDYEDSVGNWQEEIWLMNSDGSEQTQIKSLNGGGPVFTQEGKLLYHSKMQSYEICLADTDGSNIVKLTNNEAKELHPEISPDGRQVAFMSDRDGNFEIYVMNLDGSNQKRLTNNNDDDWNPSWSSDGSKIIFQSSEADGKHVNIMNKDGSSVKRFITNASGASWLKIHE